MSSLQYLTLPLHWKLTANDFKIGTIEQKKRCLRNLTLQGISAIVPKLYRKGCAEDGFRDLQLTGVEKNRMINPEHVRRRISQYERRRVGHQSCKEACIQV